MSKILVNQIANFGDNAPIEIKEGLNIPVGKPIQVAGVAGTSGQVLTSTGTSIQWTTPFNGDYNSLSNLPTIPAAQVSSDWNATSGVARILNKPVVPPQPSVTTNAAGTAALTYNSTNGQFTYTPPDLTGYATTAAVANSGNWDTAYGWGNHATAGYLTAEADTLSTVTARGATTNTNIVFPDGIQAWFGDSGDLRIYHDALGQNSYIQDAGTGELRIISNGSGIRFQQDNTETYAVFNDSGSIDLYYDNDKKFETTSEGVTITGTAGSNNLSVYGDALVFGGLTAGGLTYPITSGNAGQILTSDGAGNVVWGSSSGGGTGIALSDLSVTTNPAGSAALTYSNISGVFTYTPPDLSGYLTSYTETDPVFSISPAASISTTQINNWNSAYSWGDHSAQGYLTSYTEADTLQTVTSRGATTNQDITIEDDRYLYFGTHLQIRNRVFNGSFNHGEITHTGDSLTIQSNNFVIDAVGGTNMFDATGGGAVRIYYNGSAKIQTTNTGATITGALTAGGLTYPTTNGTAGQVLTSDGTGNVTWSTVSAGGGANVTISDTAPGVASSGDLWWESDKGRLKIYYQDTDSAQWVDASPPLQQDRIASVGAPATASSTGTAGEIRYDSNYVYICVATDTWKRAALATW